MIIIKRKKKKEVSRYTKACTIRQYISMSAQKAQRVIDQIRGRYYAETLMILELMPYRACYPILKLICSAAANENHNMCVNEANLIISIFQVTEGNSVKKLKPQARGQGYLIKRLTCHITIVFKDLDAEQHYFNSLK